MVGSYFTMVAPHNRRGTKIDFDCRGEDYEVAKNRCVVGNHGTIMKGLLDSIGDSLDHHEAVKVVLRRSQKQHTPLMQ